MKFDLIDLYQRKDPCLMANLACAKYKLPKYAVKWYHTYNLNNGWGIMEAKV